RENAGRTAEFQKKNTYRLVIDGDPVESTVGGGAGVTNFNGISVAVCGNQKIPNRRHTGGEFNTVGLARYAVPGDFACVIDVLDLDVQERHVDKDQIGERQIWRS